MLKMIDPYDPKYTHHYDDKDVATLVLSETEENILQECKNISFVCDGYVLVEDRKTGWGLFNLEKRFFEYPCIFDGFVWNRENKEHPFSIVFGQNHFNLDSNLQPIDNYTKDKIGKRFNGED